MFDELGPFYTLVVLMTGMLFVFILLGALIQETAKVRIARHATKQAEWQSTKAQAEVVKARVAAGRGLCVLDVDQPVAEMPQWLVDKITVSRGQDG